MTHVTIIGSGNMGGLTVGNTHQHLVQPCQRSFPPRASLGERPKPLG